MRRIKISAVVTAAILAITFLLGVLFGSFCLVGIHVSSAPPWMVMLGNTLTQPWVGVPYLMTSLCSGGFIAMVVLSVLLARNASKRTRAFEGHGFNFDDCNASFWETDGFFSGEELPNPLNEHIQRYMFSPINED